MSVESQLRKAANLQKKGQDREAATVYSRIVESYPGNQRAIDGLRQIRVKPVLVALSTRKLEPIHLRELIKLVDQGYLDDAADAAQRLSKIFPSHAGLANICGVVHSKLKNFDFAIACFETALKFEPDTASIYSNLGNTLLDSGQNEKARAAFSKAMDLDPSDNLATINLGRLLWSEGALQAGQNPTGGVPLRTRSEKGTYGLALLVARRRSLLEMLVSKHFFSLAARACRNAGPGILPSRVPFASSASPQAQRVDSELQSLSHVV